MNCYRHSRERYEVRIAAETAQPITRRPIPQVQTGVVSRGGSRSLSIPIQMVNVFLAAMCEFSTG